MSPKTDSHQQPTDDLVSAALNALRLGDFAKARAEMRLYASQNAYDVRHYQIEGLATLAMGDWPVARDLFGAACKDFPDQPQFWFNRGLAEENLGQLEMAASSYERSLKLKPEQGEACGNLSNIYRRQGRFPEAVQMACRALASGAPQAEAMNVLALAQAKQGSFAEAQKTFDEALALTPNDASILSNRANLAIDQLKFDEAWGFFAKARIAEDSAVIRRDEGMARLLAGDYAKGLPLYESRLDLPRALRVYPPCPRWHGEVLADKKLLLVSEQGFGDTIQFSRYALRLAEGGAELIWTVRQPLQRLLAANLPGRVMLENEPLPATDFWLPILSLPFALGMSAAIPAPPVFKASAEPRVPDANGKRKIGLVWSGSRTHERDHERSIPLTLLAPVWEKIDARFYAPFKQSHNSVIPAKAGIQMDLPHEVNKQSYSQPLPKAPLDSGFRRNDTRGDDRAATPMIPLDHLINDFADMAALLSQLDCLITIDTAAAHLAGALGVKTYLLLPHCPDWRWGTNSETTPWYASVTLLRQRSYGDWESVVNQLLKILA